MIYRGEFENPPDWGRAPAMLHLRRGLALHRLMGHDLVLGRIARMTWLQEAGYREWVLGIPISDYERSAASRAIGQEEIDADSIWESRLYAATLRAIAEDKGTDPSLFASSIPEYGIDEKPFGLFFAAAVNLCRALTAASSWAAVAPVYSAAVRSADVVGGDRMSTALPWNPEIALDALEEAGGDRGPWVESFNQIRSRIAIAVRLRAHPASELTS